MSKKSQQQVLHNKTIEVAEKSGLYSPGQIRWMRETKNERKNHKTINAHRGIQTALKKKLGYSSPYYGLNCSLGPHYFDKPSNVPSASSYSGQQWCNVMFKRYPWD